MVSRRSLTWMLAACLLLTSCRSFATALPTPDLAPEETPPPLTFTPEPGYVTRLRHAEYQLGATDVLRLVQLTDGKFEQGAGTDQMTVTATAFIAKGDIDGSGQDGYAMLVSEDYGGSGSFMFLAVYADVNGTPKFLTSRMVDDRPQINELSVQDGNQIFLDAVVHAPQDPMCCPALRTSRHYRLDGTGMLMMADYTTFTPDGRPRTVTIQSPVDHTEIYGSVRIQGSVAIAPFENNLLYRIVDAGGVELAIGSITVTAPEAGAAGTFDQTILLGNILSGTAVRLEVQDLNVADGSLLAMDSVELIVK